MSAEYKLEQSFWGNNSLRRDWESLTISPSHIKESDISPSGSWNDTGSHRMLDGTLNIPLSIKIGEKYYHHPIGTDVIIGEIIRSNGTRTRKAVVISKPKEGAMKGGRRKRTMKKRGRKSRTRKGSQRT